MLAGSRYGKEKDDDPRNANFGPHLQVHTSKAGVQGCAHEIIVEEISRHTHRSAGQNSMQIGDERNPKAINHGDGHQVTEIVNYFGEAKDMEIVNREGCDEGDVEADQSVAVVLESLVVEGRNKHAFLFITGENPGDEELEEEITRIDFPGVAVGARIL